jgi:hypothetical protein
MTVYQAKITIAVDDQQQNLDEISSNRFHQLMKELARDEINKALECVCQGSNVTHTLEEL